MEVTNNNYAFIDSQNLNLSVRDQGWKLDYAKFRIYLKEKYHVAKAYLFIGYVPKYQSLYTSLQEQGYFLVFKPTLILPNGKAKGNTDSELVLHAAIELPAYNKAVIVCGDGDCYCLVKYLKEKNKLEKLIIPNRFEYSSLLRDFVPDMAFVTDLRGKLEWK
jgi:uncharacterized LabA/DUF88 family protein